MLQALQIYFFALFFEDSLMHLLYSGDSTPPIFPFESQTCLSCAEKLAAQELSFVRTVNL